MRCLVAVAITLGLVSPARAEIEAGASVAVAEADAQHVRTVVGKYARQQRRARVFASVSGLVLGAALLPLGYHVAATAEPGGLVDLSEFQRGFGYTLIGTGVLGLVSTTLVLIKDTPPERIHRELEHAAATGDLDRGVIRARSEIAAVAAQARRTRKILLGVGLGSFAVGMTTMLVGGSSSTLDTDVRLAMILGGGGVAILGGSCLGVGLVESPLEKMHRELRQPSYTAGIVPIRGGALFGLATTF